MKTYIVRFSCGAIGAGYYTEKKGKKTLEKATRFRNRKSAQAVSNSLMSDPRVVSSYVFEWYSG